MSENTGTPEVWENLKGKQFRLLQFVGDSTLQISTKDGNIYSPKLLNPNRQRNLREIFKSLRKKEILVLEILNFMTSDENDAPFILPIIRNRKGGREIIGEDFYI